MTDDNECALCGQETEQDWAEQPPKPKCYGCADATQHHREKYE